jgi:hypothetical protein
LPFRDISKITLCFLHAFTWRMAGESRATFGTALRPEILGPKTSTQRQLGDSFRDVFLISVEFCHFRGPSSILSL